MHKLTIYTWCGDVSDVIVLQTKIFYHKKIFIIKVKYKESIYTFTIFVLYVYMYFVVYIM